MARFWRDQRRPQQARWRLALVYGSFTEGLVVKYLGMRVNAWTGLKTLFGLGPQIKNSVDQKPEGLLLHENFIMSLIPLHLGMRQYWRDFDTLEAWSRSTPHREWWRDFLQSSRGTGFWHEAYFVRGGMEAVYDDVPVRLGFGQFAPLLPPGGRCFRPGTAPSRPVSRLRRWSKRPNFMALRARSSRFGRGRGSGATTTLANCSRQSTAGLLSASTRVI